MRPSLQIGDYSSSQAVGRNQLCKQKQQRDNVKRMKDGAVRGSKDQQQCDDRGTSAGNTKLLAKMQHDHTLRAQELKVVSISKQFDMSKTLLETKMKLMEMECDPAK